MTIVNVDNFKMVVVISIAKAENISFPHWAYRYTSNIGLYINFNQKLGSFGKSPYSRNAATKIYLLNFRPKSSISFVGF